MYTSTLSHAWNHETDYTSIEAIGLFVYGVTIEYVMAKFINALLPVILRRLNGT